MASRSQLIQKRRNLTHAVACAITRALYGRRLRSGTESCDFVIGRGRGKFSVEAKSAATGSYFVFPSSQVIALDTEHARCVLLAYRRLGAVRSNARLETSDVLQSIVWVADLPGPLVSRICKNKRSADGQHYVTVSKISALNTRPDANCRIVDRMSLNVTGERVVASHITVWRIEEGSEDTRASELPF